MAETRVPTGTWVDEWEWSARHRLAAELDGAAPGPDLARTLGEIELADVDEAALVEVVAAWERVVAWATAQQVAGLQELARRRRAEEVADEVAARLSCTQRVAEGKVGLALGLTALPEVADALARGEIDGRRAGVLVDDLAHLPPDEARQVAVDALPAARTCTAPALRARLRRLELVRDPGGAAARHGRARAERRVELHPAPDAMAWLSAYLPAEDAVAVRDTLTALASCAADGDERSLDQRRADALVDLTTRWLDAGVAPDGTPLPTRQGRRPHLVLTASLSTVLGLDDAPADLAGYGPVPADVARRVASRATWEPLLVSSRTGEPLARSTRRYAPTTSLRDAVALRDRTCTFPGCRTPADRCDLDHVEPYDDGVAAGGGARGSPPTDQTRVDSLQDLCRHHHNLKTHGGWAPLRTPDGRSLWRSPSGRVYRRDPAYLPPPDAPPDLPPTTVDRAPPRWGGPLELGPPTF